MTKSIYQLETVTCPSCIRRIELSIGKLNGVSQVNVKFNASKVEVDYDEQVITKDKIGASITTLGYKILNVK